jgi:multisubunit Na+/H+ antiporter MnhB subunit
MTNAPELQMFGWLIFAWGLALMVISVRLAKKKQNQVHSRTRRIAGVLGGAVFCLLAAILIWANSSTSRAVLLGGAIIAAALSWYLGRHAKKMDRAMR